MRRKEFSSFTDLAFTKFVGFTCSLVQYPRTYKAFLKVRDMIVQEVVTGKLEPFHKIVSAKHTLEESVEPFFFLQYDHLPLDRKVEDAIVIKMLPLQFILNPNVLDTLLDFFHVEQGELEAIAGLQAAAQGALEGMTAQTKAGLESAIEEHKNMDIHVEIDAPIFLLPTDVNIAHSPLLVIDAGHLQIKSDLIDQELRKGNSTLSATSFEQLLDMVHDKQHIVFLLKILI